MSTEKIETIHVYWTTVGLIEDAIRTLKADAEAKKDRLKINNNLLPTIQNKVNEAVRDRLSLPPGSRNELPESLLDVARLHFELDADGSDLTIKNIFWEMRDGTIRPLIQPVE